MRILLVTTSFGSRCAAPLAQDLAGALSGHHEVQVLAIDWSAPAGRPTRTYRDSNGSQVILASPARGGRIGKWIFSSLKLRRAARRMGRFDQVILFGPVSPLAFAPMPATRKVAYLTDFIPFNLGDLGVLPPSAVRLLGMMESALLRRFDTIAVMSPAGAEYLSRHYALSGQQVVTIPLWGAGPPHPSDRKSIRRKYGLPLDRPIALFAGRGGTGRAVEDAIAASVYSPALFLIVGPESLQQGGNVRHMQSMAHGEYLELAQACDVGLVATPAAGRAPTFPSKTIDYLRCGLPIAASVESATDYGEIIQALGVGVAVPAGNPLLLAKAVDECLAARPAMQARAKEAMATVFSAETAAEAFLSAGIPPRP